MIERIYRIARARVKKVVYKDVRTELEIFRNGFDEEADR